MTRRHMLISVSAFSLFALLGPLIRHVFWGRLQTAMDNVLLLIWLARFLSAGGQANNLHDRVMSVGVNIALFALWGLLTGALAKRTRMVVALYVALCALIGLFLAWALGVNGTNFPWSALAIALVLYSLPFWAVAWSCHTLQHARTSLTSAVGELSPLSTMPEY